MASDSRRGSSAYWARSGVQGEGDTDPGRHDLSGTAAIPIEIAAILPHPGDQIAGTAEGIVHDSIVGTMPFDIRERRPQIHGQRAIRPDPLAEHSFDHHFERLVRFEPARAGDALPVFTLEKHQISLTCFQLHHSQTAADDHSKRKRRMP
jgi:hypothetical protein